MEDSRILEDLTTQNGILLELVKLRNFNRGSLEGMA